MPEAGVRIRRTGRTSQDTTTCAPGNQGAHALAAGALPAAAARDRAGAEALRPR